MCDEIDKKLINKLKELKSDCKALEKVSLITHSLLNDHRYLNSFIESSSNRLHACEVVSKVLAITHGDGVVLTGHGINRTLDSRFDDETKHEIFKKIKFLCDRLQKNLGVDWFLTSGTLLGLVRDNACIKHDDDIDVAYVSKFDKQKDILHERHEIYNFINSIDNFNAKDCGGGHFWVTFKSENLNFLFDLFTSWSDGDYLNEYPLQPNVIPINAILPTQSFLFYGVGVNIPNNPDALLVINYGDDWKIPDPSFRFNFSRHNDFYRFLLSSKIRG